MVGFSSLIQRRKYEFAYVVRLVLAKYVYYEVPRESGGGLIYVRVGLGSHMTSYINCNWFQDKVGGLVCVGWCTCPCPHLQ